MQTQRIWTTEEDGEKVLMEELGCGAAQPPTLFLMQPWYSLNLTKGYIGDVPLHSLALHFRFGDF